MNKEKIINLAQQTIGNHFIKGDQLQFRASENELLDFANQLFALQVEQACERMRVHQKSSQLMAKIRSAHNAGVTNEHLGKLIREFLSQPSNTVED